MAKKKKVPVIEKNDDGEEMSIIQRAQREHDDYRPGKGATRTITKMAFALWLTIPVRYLGAPDNIVSKLGISDPDMLELIKIRSMKEFGAVCKIGHFSLTEWRKEIMDDDEFDVRRVFRPLMKEGLAALFEGLLEHKDAERFKAYAGFVQGWMPGLQLKHSGAIDTLGEEERATLDDIIARNTK